MADSLWGRGLQTTQRTYRAHAQAREDTQVITLTYAREPLFFLVDLCLSRVCSPTNVDATTETTCVPSLIQKD